MVWKRTMKFVKDNTKYRENQLEKYGIGMDWGDRKTAKRDEDFKEAEKESAESSGCRKDKSTLQQMTRSVAHKICDVKLVLLELVCPQLEYGGLALAL